VVIDPEYFDVKLEPNADWGHDTQPGHTVFTYLFAGAARYGERGEEIPAGTGTVVLLGDGDRVSVTSGGAGARFLFVSGRPLHEPIAWGGPIVMNTLAELEVAWRELEAGTFVKHRPTPEV
jgi:redox-sensitive bicupin YhaK (pirin superfamily)